MSPERPIIKILSKAARLEMKCDTLHGKDNLVLWYRHGFSNRAAIEIILQL